MLLLMTFIVVVTGATPLWAQDGDPHPLMDVLALIPDGPEVRAYGVSYIDYAGIVAARPGTPEITGWEAFDKLDNSTVDADDEALGLWMASIMGVYSGPPDLLQNIFTTRDEMKGVVGFDFFDLERGATYLAPPNTVTLLQGEFDEGAISDALVSRDYSVQTLGGMTLFCGPNGCDGGMNMDMDNRNPANPFGGQFGRSQPVLVGQGTVISSASDVLLTGYLALEDGTLPSMADAPDVQAVTRVILPAGTLIQAHIYDAASFPPADFTQALLDPEMTDEERDAVIEDLQAEIEAGAENALPYYSLVVFADFVDGDEQLVLIGLVFPDARTAQIAVEVLSARINAYESVALRQPLTEIFVGREIVMGDPELVGDWETGLVTVVLPFRSPMPPQEPGEGFPRFVQSSMVFKLFVEMVYRRDLPWLAVGG